MHNVESVWQRSPVVVGVDGSRAHPAIIDLAVAEAVRRGASLLIVHAWPGRYFGSLRTRGPMPTKVDGRHLLDLAARRAQHRAPHLEISTDLADGSPAHVLALHSQRARLVVVGHRDAMFTRPSWGSTAAYLAHRSACPLLVHRGAAAERGPVVLAASARQPVTATAACAYEQAALRGSRLVAVHIWTHPSERDTGSSTTVADNYAADRHEAERHLAEALAGWAWTYPDVAVDRLVLHDLDVAYTLEQASRRGRLLVAGMGRHGRSAGVIYGSLGRALMRHAECPVLLVPPAWRHPAMTTVPGVAAVDLL